MQPRQLDDRQDTALFQVQPLSMLATAFQNKSSKQTERRGAGQDIFCQGSKENGIALAVRQHVLLQAISEFAFTGNGAQIKKDADSHHRIAAGAAHPGIDSGLPVAGALPPLG